MRSEFDFIQHIKKKYGLNRIGDDCAVLPKDAETDTVITADMLVQDIDFRLDWTTPEFLGHKALAGSLSDVAAMGAEPKWAMLSIGLPEPLWRSDFLDSAYHGWHELAKESGVELVGGDISRVPDKVVIDSIVLGEVPKGCAVLRSEAKPGQGIFITGPLGASAGGLQLLKEGFRFSETIGPGYYTLLLEHLRPNPRTTTGIRLRKDNIASAMMDISDGLSSDIRHLCDASGVGARIFADQLPIHPRISRAFNAADQALNLALHGGEDFELLFTVSEENNSSDHLADFYKIGEITANPGIIELITDGKAEELPPRGYRHF